MASELDICNLALQWVGQPPITNLLAPTNRPEQMCALNYPIVRDACLNEHAWSFATRIEVLTPTGNAPAWGTDTEFQTPTDTLTVLRLYDNPGLTTPIQPENWGRRGRVIYSSSKVAYAQLIVRETDTTLYPPVFVHALAARLAAELAIGMTDSLNLADYLANQYQVKIREAVASDSIQGRRERFTATRLINARHR